MSVSSSKQRIRQRFNRAAPDYEAASVLHREVESRVMERLDLVRMTPETVLDIGAGPGTGSEALMRRYKKARVYALDLAENMLHLAKKKAPFLRKLRCVCGDAEHLPFAEDSFDLIYSNLSLQWVTDLEATFKEFQRVLKPGGLLMFTTFGPDTLKELRAAWAQVDGQESNRAHVNTFIDMHDIGDALLNARFAEPVVDMEMFTLTYQDARAVMKDLKVIGAQTVMPGEGASQASGLTGRQRMQAVMDAYDGFRRDGLVPATYEVVYGHAWMPETPIQEKRDDGSVAVPIKGIGSYRP